MDLVYKTEDELWGIGLQGNLFDSESFYSIYRNYPGDGWSPYTFNGGSLKSCFEWLQQKSIITLDEMKHQISLRS